LALPDAIRIQEECAALDGVEHIAEDGTVSLTSHARGELSALSPELARDLSPEHALERFELLRQLLWARASDSQPSSARATYLA